MIGVFAYAFAHRKTHDFLVEIALSGIRDVTVFAAPFKKLETVDRTAYFRTAYQPLHPRDTAYLCQQLGFRYIEIAHDDVEGIADLVKRYGLRIGIISGARILKQSVIDVFSEGVVNFHPGKIPETSGLDAFFYTIKNNVELGITTHFIDARVDAGHFLAFDAIKLHPDNTMEDVIENGYRQQIQSLRTFLINWQDGTLTSHPIDRPRKNSPMSVEEKWACLKLFASWRMNQVAKQDKRQLFASCVSGEAHEVASQLSQVPDLLECRSEQGWTPLIVASFHQHLNVVEVLLEAGADPNAVGKKGTTVLMYAKTALVGQAQPDTQLLDLLIENGADVYRSDMFGKNIIDYIPMGDPLVAYFERHEERETCNLLTSMPSRRA